jgi:hypothetical protein
LEEITMPSIARSLIVLGAVAALAAGSARADVHWSVGIHAPVAPGVTVGTVISDRPYAPVVVAPAPVYVPAPVYAPPPPVYVPPPIYVPAPVAYAQVEVPAPRVVYAPVWVNGRWVHHRHAHRWQPYPQHRGHRAPLPVYRPGREVRY